MKRSALELTATSPFLLLPGFLGKGDGEGRAESPASHDRLELCEPMKRDSVHSLNLLPAVLPYQQPP